MKLINPDILENNIRLALAEKCAARCLDDESDFEAVMEVVSSTIEEWLEKRREGCR